MHECKAGKCVHSIADLIHAFILLIAALVNMNMQCFSTHLISVSHLTLSYLFQSKLLMLSDQ